MPAYTDIELGDTPTRSHGDTIELATIDIASQDKGEHRALSDNDHSDDDQPRASFDVNSSPDWTEHGLDSDLGSRPGTAPSGGGRDHEVSEPDHTDGGDERVPLLRTDSVRSILKRPQWFNPPPLSRTPSGNTVRFELGPNLECGVPSDDTGNLGALGSADRTSIAGANPGQRTRSGYQTSTSGRNSAKSGTRITAEESMRRERKATITMLACMGIAFTGSVSVVGAQAAGWIEGGNWAKGNGTAIGIGDGTDVGIGFRADPGGTDIRSIEVGPELAVGSTIEFGLNDGTAGE